MPVYSLTERQFDALQKPIYPALSRLAAHRVGRNDAEDMALLSLAQAWNAISRFDPTTGSAGLLRFTVPYLRANCRQWLRVRMRRGEVLLPPNEILRLAERGEPPDVSAPCYAAFRDELYALLHAVRLTSLQETCLREWLGGVTQAGIAEYLQISQQSVSQHIAAGAARLRNAHYWETEVGAEVWRFFWECVEAQRRAVYHRPSGVWDHQYVTVEQRTRKARVWSLADERERGTL